MRDGTQQAVLRLPVFCRSINPHKYPSGGPFGMQCPSCGAPCNASTICEDCGLNLDHEMRTSDFEPSFAVPDDAEESIKPAADTTPVSRLIEFPGVTRHSVPDWRKEVAERVREAQDRKAREAAAEAQLNLMDQTEKPQLELLPQAETPPINPLVAAALKRIERAHAEPAVMAARAGRSSRMTAVAYASENAYHELPTEPVQAKSTTTATLLDSSPDTINSLTFLEDQSNEPEKPHNLVVVPPPSVETVAVKEDKPRPRRVIGDDISSPALNYLDSVSTTIHPEDVTNRASVSRRLVAGILDLILLAIISIPFVVAAEWMKPTWRDPKVIAFAIGISLTLTFLYSTICTALTGRTFGMKLLSLRVVDERTGLIPTGKQCGERALIFTSSLLTAGILLAYALVDPDKRAIHDKFTRTAVIKI
jgi:uncharacterized RDD family membrane protein YckC